MKLPKQYQWLGQEEGPRHLLKALELYGVTEVVGPKHNPVILGWAKECSLQNVYRADETPWCGLFIAVIMLRAGREPVKDPLWALNWNKFGVKVDKPMLGDVLTFSRNGGGHVGLYVGEDAKYFYVLGGNQGNQVSVTKIDKARLSQARRPAYISMPTNIRSIQLCTAGVVSTNEA